MGDELWDEFDLPSTEDPRMGLAIRGGYCRDEVWLGITEPDGSVSRLVVVDGAELRRILNSMNIGRVMLTRRKRRTLMAAPARRRRT